MCVPSRMDENAFHQPDVSAVPFPREDMQHYLHQASLSLEIQDLEFNTWSISLETQNGPKLAMNLVSHGILDANDADQVASLEGLILSSFTTDLKAKKGNSSLISNAILAAGHVHCLLSEMSYSQRVRTMMKGREISKRDEPSTVEIVFKCMVFLHLGDIIGAVAAGIPLDNMAEDEDEGLHSYVAAVLLLHEVNCIHTTLRDGGLSNLLLPPELGEKLRDWSKSLEKGLAPMVRSGCDIFPNWQGALNKSKKRFKNHHRRERAQMTIDLQQNIHPSVPFDEMGENSAASASRLSETPPSEPPVDDIGPLQNTSLEDFNASDKAWSEVPNQISQQSMAINNIAAGQIVPGFFDSVDFDPPFDYNANPYLDPEYEHVDSYNWMSGPGFSST